MPDHLGSHLDLLELLPVVDRDVPADVRRQDERVADVGPDDLVGGGRLHPLEEERRLDVESAADGSSRTAGGDLRELLEAHRLELRQRETTVRELPLPASLDLLRLPRLRHVQLPPFCSRRRFFTRTDRENRPTFAPGQVPLATVLGRPTCWCAPPPKGWLTGFIATPRTLNAARASERVAQTFLPALMI